MKLGRGCALALAAVLALTSCMVGDGDDEPGDEALTIEAGGRYRSRVFGVKVTSDVVYTPGLALDLYEPAGDRAGMRPAIVWVHGGAFARNSKLDPNLVRIARYFAQLGYVTASIDYRLLNPNGDAGFPYPGDAVNAARDDAREAVRFLRRNAATYRIDPTRIAIGGASAGAMAALHAAYAGGDRTGAGVRAVVDLWGALEGVEQLGADDTGSLVVFHGTADDFWMPYRQALALRDRARAVGIACEFHPVDGAGHAPWDQLDRFLPLIARFLLVHLVNA